MTPTLVTVLRRLAGVLALSAILPTPAVLATPLQPSLELISKPHQPRSSSFGDSSEIELSADGRWAAFASTGTGLTTNAVDEFVVQVYLRNLETGATTLVSRNEAGEAGNQHSYASFISADGRFVLFESEADNLVPDDTNEGTDLILYDRTTDQLSAVSSTTNGIANGSSAYASLTPNGRFILFESDATDFSELDDNETADLYLLDRESGNFELVTLNSNNVAVAGASVPVTSLGDYEASVSGDGRYVAFASSATNLAPGLASPWNRQIFVRDMQAGRTRWLTRNSENAGSRFVSTPVVSSNGAYVLFLSENLDSPPFGTDLILYLFETATAERVAITNAVESFTLSGNSHYIAFTAAGQLYLHDIAAGTNGLISAAPDGTPGSGISAEAAISDDGRYVVFTSNSTNLVSGVTGDIFQLYRLDRQTGDLALLSRGIGDVAAETDTHFPVVSGGGTIAGFMSYDSNLVPNDNIGQNDVFVVATSGLDPVTLVSTPDPSAISSTASGSSYLEFQALALDGRSVVFSSVANDLVPNDTNDSRDIFLHDRVNGVTTLISKDTNGVQLAGPSTLAGVSLDGRVIAFSASNIVDNLPGRSVFVFDAANGATKIGSILPDNTIASTILDAVLTADGRHLAFRETATPVYLRDLKENKTTIVGTAGTSGLIGLSPSGTYLFTRGLGSTLAVNDTSLNRLLTNFANVDFTIHSVSADESSLLIPVRGFSGPTYILTLQKLDGSGPALTIATNSAAAAMSLDGSTIAYQLRVNTDNANPLYNLFFLDVRSNITTALELGGTNASVRLRGQPVLSANGRYVAFSATNSLVAPSEEYSFSDLYVYDRVLKTISLASQNLSGGEGEFGSSSASLSADGSILAFDSAAGDLIANDRNLASDIFVFHFAPTDSDSDGLDDGWETSLFGNLSATADADADNDGLSNRDEFLAGTDPNSASSALAVAFTMPAADMITLTTPAVIGRTYQVQHRASLGTGEWNDLGAPITALSSEVAFEIPGAAEAAGFFRLKAL